MFFAKVKKTRNKPMKSQDFYKQLKKQLNKTINGSKMINEEAMLYVQSAINHLFDKFDIV